MIVLLSDFGESEYVGVMKGVIYSLYSGAKITDLTHTISPQSIREGAWILFHNYTYFPKKSIFVCVVDPGVGTQRDAVVVTTRNYVFIGPDNGLMYPAAKDDKIVSVSSITIGKNTSKTFHGRDVFARMAGYHLLGKANRMLGGFKSDLTVKLDFHLDGREGQVVRIDHFGNIVTNIPSGRKKEYTLTTKNLRWTIDWYPSYADGPASGVFLVTGSNDTLEISAKNASASNELNFKVGDILTLR